MCGRESTLPTHAYVSGRRRRLADGRRTRGSSPLKSRWLHILGLTHQKNCSSLPANLHPSVGETKKPPKPALVAGWPPSPLYCHNVYDRHKSPDIKKRFFPSPRMNRNPEPPPPPPPQRAARASLCLSRALRDVKVFMERSRKCSLLLEMKGKHKKAKSVTGGG